MDEKNYVFGCLLVTMTLLAAVTIFNYWQDPAGIFAESTTYETVARASGQGKALVVSGNYNERVFVKSVIDFGDNDYDVIVLGSSRVMTIGNENISPHLKLHCLAVSGGGLEDDVAIWHRYKTRMKVTPKVVIIDGAPWLFNRNNGEHRWKMVWLKIMLQALMTLV